MTTFEADLVSKMSNGSRTNKKLSSNVIIYFDTFNSETQKAFEEVFGPQSIIYDHSKRIEKIWMNKYGKAPYNYEYQNGIQHISHEFFQLFRYSNLQEKWLLEILRIFNEDYTKDYRDMRLNNILRIMAHINRFGFVDNLYKYKFLEYLTPYLKDALEMDGDVGCDKEYREIKERFLFRQLLQYLFHTISKNMDEVFINTACNTLKQILCHEEAVYNLEINNRIKLLFEEAAHFDNPEIKKLVTIIYNAYWDLDLKNKIDIQQVKSIVSEAKNVKIKTMFTVEDIF